VWQLSLTTDELSAIDLAAALRARSDKTEILGLRTAIGTMGLYVAFAAFAGNVLSAILLEGTGRTVPLLCALVSPVLVVLGLRSRLRLDEHGLRVDSRSLLYSDIARVVLHGNAMHIVLRTGAVLKLFAVGPLASRFVVARWTRCTAG
jgi:hypothetical protein